MAKNIFVEGSNLRDFLEETGNNSNFNNFYDEALRMNRVKLGLLDDELDGERYLEHRMNAFDVFNDVQKLTMGHADATACLSEEQRNELYRHLQQGTVLSDVPRIEAYNRDAILAIVQNARLECWNCLNPDCLRRDGNVPYEAVKAKAEEFEKLITLKKKKASE